MYGTFMRENREIPRSPARLISGRAVQGTRVGTPEMHERGKSDRPVVPANPPNKALAAEVGEERGRAKGNTTSKTHPGHSAGQGASIASYLTAHLASARLIGRQALTGLALAHGYDTAFWWIAGTFAGGAVIGGTLLRRGPLVQQRAPSPADDRVITAQTAANPTHPV